MKSYAVVWEFRVRDNALARFKKAYGPSGDWAKLFRKGKGYMGTQLLCDLKDPRRFITLDFWSSYGAHARFRKKYMAEYRALDEKCEELTEQEVRIGEFERHSDSERA